MTFQLHSGTVAPPISNSEGTEDFFDEERIHNSILSILCEKETIWREPQPLQVPVVNAELATLWFKGLKSTGERVEFLFALLEGLTAQERTILKGHLCCDSHSHSASASASGASPLVKDRRRNSISAKAKVPSSPSSSSSSSCCGIDLRIDLAGNVPSWLRWHRLHKYTVNLGDFPFERLVCLTDAQLQSLGVEAVGARRKLLRLFSLIKGHALRSMEGQVISLSKVADGIFLLTMHNHDNRMNPQFFTEFHAALDIVDQQQALGLITTGTGRFFSNGLDIAFLYKHQKEAICKRFFPDYFYPLCSRLLTLQYPTVALLNGHAYAGGMVLAMSHDYCTMLNQKSGVKMCMNEISLGSPIPLGMVELLRLKFNKRHQFMEALLKPTAFTAEMAFECELVQHVGENVEEMLQWAIECCKQKKDNVSAAFALVKHALNAPAIEALKCKQDIPIDALFSKL